MRYATGAAAPSTTPAGKPLVGEKAKQKAGLTEAQLARVAQKYGVNLNEIGFYYDAGDVKNGRIVEGRFRRGELPQINLAALKSEKHLGEKIRHETIHAKLSSALGIGMLRQFAKDRMTVAIRRELELKGYKQRAGETLEQYHEALADEWITRMHETHPTLFKELVQRAKEFLSKVRLRDLTDDEVAKSIVRAVAPQSVTEIVKEQAKGTKGAKPAKSVGRQALGAVAPLTAEERETLDVFMPDVPNLEQVVLHGDKSEAVLIDEERGVATPNYSLGSFADGNDEGYYEQLMLDIVQAGIASPKEARKFMADITSIAAQIFEHGAILDYENEGEGVFSALKENADAMYGVSVDFTTVCRKSAKLFATISEIMARNQNGLSAEDVWEIRRQLDASNEVNCAACYVFSRWVNMGSILNNMAETFPNVPRDLIFDPRKSAELARRYPEAWAWKKARGSGAGKSVESRTAYAPGEVQQHFTQKDIDNQNRFSGVRMQSWSDFDPLHVIDLAQVVADLAASRLAAHAYTKVEDFVRMMAPTGVAINMSLIPEGSGLDTKGRLVFSAKEGMDPKVAYRLRTQHRTAGTIAIGANDEHIRAMLLDPRIDYIIPYHASGLSKQFQELAGMASWTDYTSTQGDRVVDEALWEARTARLMKQYGMTKAQAEGRIMPWEYWDSKLSGDENAQRFIEYCATVGVTPRFSQFLNEDGSAPTGWWKLLVDRRMYDTAGNYVEQLPVQLKLDMRVVNDIFAKYLRGEGRYDQNPDMGVVDKYTKRDQGDAYVRSTTMGLDMAQEESESAPEVAEQAPQLARTEVKKGVRREGLEQRPAREPIPYERQSLGEVSDEGLERFSFETLVEEARTNPPKAISRDRSTGRRVKLDRERKDVLYEFQHKDGVLTVRLMAPDDTMQLRTPRKEVEVLFEFNDSYEKSDNQGMGSLRKLKDISRAVLAEIFTRPPGTVFRINAELLEDKLHPDARIKTYTSWTAKLLEEGLVQQAWYTDDVRNNGETYERWLYFTLRPLPEKALRDEWGPGVRLLGTEKESAAAEIPGATMITEETEDSPEIERLSMQELQQDITNNPLTNIIESKRGDKVARVFPFRHNGDLIEVTATTTVVHAGREFVSVAFMRNGSYEKFDELGMDAVPVLKHILKAILTDMRLRTVAAVRNGRSAPVFAMSAEESPGKKNPRARLVSYPSMVKKFIQNGIAKQGWFVSNDDDTTRYIYFTREPLSGPESKGLPRSMTTNPVDIAGWSRSSERTRGHAGDRESLGAETYGKTTAAGYYIPLEALETGRSIATPQMLEVYRAAKAHIPKEFEADLVELDGKKARFIKLDDITAAHPRVAESYTADASGQTAHRTPEPGKGQIYHRMETMTMPGKVRDMHAEITAYEENLGALDFDGKTASGWEHVWQEQVDKKLGKGAFANMQAGVEAIRAKHLGAKTMAAQQKITSEKTSREQASALVKKVPWVKGTTNTDIGAGKSMLTTLGLRERGVTNRRFDPFNVDKATNKATAEAARTEPTDTATASNLLNVVAEAAVRDNIVLQAAKAIKPEGTAYFLIYEGDGSGQGRATRDGWQANRKTKDFVPEIEKHFGDVKVTDGMIVARDPQVEDKEATWQVGREASDEDVRFSTGEVVRPLSPFREAIRTTKGSVAQMLDKLVERGGAHATIAQALLDHSRSDFENTDFNVSRSMKFDAWFREGTDGERDDIGITRGMLHAYDDNQIAGLLVHEVVHSRTQGLLPEELINYELKGQKYLEALDQHAAREDAPAGLAELIATYKEAIALANVPVEALGNPGHKAVISARGQVPAKGEVMYGFATIGEFVSEALSNPDFQYKLNQMKLANPAQHGGAGSVWQALVNAITKMLGLDVKAGSVLESTLRSSGQLIQRREATTTEERGPKTKQAKPAETTTYAQAVENHDIAMAQKLVDAKAKQAGWVEYYHASDSAWTLTEDRPLYLSRTKRVAHGYNPEGVLRRVFVKLTGRGLYKGAPGEASFMHYGMTELARRLDKEGYAGIEAREAGGPANEVVIFHPPGIVKTADAFSHDESGAVIPLDERFDNEDPDIRYSFAGEQGMERLGRTPEFSALWDKKARAEIDDSVMTFKRGAFEKFADGEQVFREGRLADLIKHPELFKAYPDLQDTKVIVWVGKDYTKGGGYSAETDSIEVQAPDMAEAVDTLLHEIQHAIQKREGWARGSSPTDPALTQDLRADTEHLTTKYNELLNKLNNQKLNPKKRTLERYDYGFSRAQIAELRKELGQVGRLMALAQKVREQIAMRRYTKTAGEFEARLSASRGAFSAASRQRQPALAPALLTNDEPVVGADIPTAFEQELNGADQMITRMSPDEAFQLPQSERAALVEEGDRESLGTDRSTDEAAIAAAPGHRVIDDITETKLFVTGQPVLIAGYHQTRRPETLVKSGGFKSRYLGETYGATNDSLGWYFSGDGSPWNYEEDYQGKRGGTLSAWIKLKNPLVIDADKVGIVEAPRSQIEAIHDQMEAGGHDGIIYVWDSTGGENNYDMTTLSTLEVRKQVRSEYDRVVGSLTEASKQLEPRKLELLYRLDEQMQNWMDNKANVELPNRLVSWARKVVPGAFPEHLFEEQVPVEKELPPGSKIGDKYWVIVPTEGANKKIKVRGKTSVGGRWVPTEQRYDDTRDDIRYSLGPAAGQPAMWEVGGNPTGRFERWRRAIQDKALDLRYLVRAIEQWSGSPLPDERNPYLLGELYRARTAEAVARFTEEKVKPFQKTVADAGFTMEQVDEFLHMEHAEERNKHIARINPAFANLPSSEKGGSGLAPDTIAAYQRSLSAADRARLEALARQVYGWRDEMQQILVRSGQETQETIDQWNRTYKKYVPLMRDEFADEAHISSGSGTSGRGSFVRRAAGSQREVFSPITGMAMNMEKAIIREEKSRVSQAVWALAVNAPNDNFWLAVDPMRNSTVKAQKLWTEIQAKAAAYNAAPTQAKLKELNKLITQYREARRDQASQHPQVIRALTQLGLGPQDAVNVYAEPQVPYFDKNGLVRWHVNPQLRQQPGVYNVRINGIDRMVIFNTNWHEAGLTPEQVRERQRAEQLVHGLKNMDMGDLGKVLGTIGVATRWIAMVNTQWSPIFGVRNVVRDYFTSSLNLQNTPLAGKQLQLQVTAAQFAFAQLAPGAKLSATDEALFRQFKEYGGQTAHRNMFEAARDYEKEMQQIFAEARGTGTIVRARKLARAVAGPLDAFNATTETMFRFAAFKLAIEEGLSPERAALIAKDITVNFDRKGNNSSQIGALWAFFNASAQGSVTMAQTMFNKNGSLTKAGWQIIAGGVLLGVAQALYLRAKGVGDDDDPKQYDREKNLLWEFPFGSGIYRKIPMPLGYHILPNFGRIATEMKFGDERDTKKKLLDLSLVVIDAFSPLGTGNPVQIITPTVVDPLVNVGMDTDWNQRPIAKPELNPRQPEPYATRTRDTASTVARGLAFGIEWLAGGREGVRGRFGLTPDQIDYLIGYAGGAAARELLVKPMQYVAAKNAGVDLPSYKTPLVGGFSVDTTDKGNQAGRYYEATTKVLEAESVREYRRTHKLGLTGFAEEFPEIRLLQRMKDTESQIRELKQQREALKARGGGSALIKLRTDKITALMERFNNAYEKLHKERVERQNKEAEL